MEQLGGEDRGKGEENKQHHEQQQKCPRCDSVNTKFCYYNNYSLSQPRYYCKSCKRYWTQGGTLRNIPVGGSRKGKRANNTSSSSSSSSHKPYSRSSSSQPHDHQVIQAQNQSNLLVGPSPPTMVPPIGGFLSSLPAVHSLNPPPQSLNFGFNDVQQHSQQILVPSSRFNNNMVIKAGNAGEVAIASQHGLIIPSSIIMNDPNHRANDAALWSTISTTTSISANNSHTNIRGSSSSSSSSTLIPNNHWPHLPGYQPPPPQS